MQATSKGDAGWSTRDWFRLEVRPVLTAEAVYGRLGLGRKGRYLRGPCPFHDDGDKRSRRFSVDLATLGYKCFSCDASGDVLAFIAGGTSPRGTDYWRAVLTAADLAGKSAPEWLRRKAGETADSSRNRPERPRRARIRRQAVRSEAAHAHDGGGREEKHSQAERSAPASSAHVPSLLGAAVSADGTPASAYLHGRFAWPPFWNLPGNVLWIPASAVRAILPGAWSLPTGAAGCLAFAYRHPADGRAKAVKLEALSADGRLVEDAKGKRWRRNAGEFKGLRFVASDLPGGHHHVGEGEVTALALAVQCKARGRGMAVACGGASGMVPAACSDPEGRPVIVHSDRDAKGRIAARTLRAALRSAGRPAVAIGTAESGNDGWDAADALRAEVEERASIREVEGKQARATAERGAWSDTLAMLADGGLEL